MSAGKYIRTPEIRAKISQAHRGKKHSPITRQKISNAHKGNRYAWKGDNVSYHGLHKWIREHLGSPMKCSNCDFETSNFRLIHWANKSHEYKRELTDWLRLCSKCHGLYDRQYRLSLKEGK